LSPAEVQGQDGGEDDELMVHGLFLRLVFLGFG
jgi:hypothetical protein